MAYSYQEKSEFWKNFLNKSEYFEPNNFSEKSEKFSKKNFPAEHILSENFLQNILIEIQFENLYKFSEIWEFGQNSENF